MLSERTELELVDGVPVVRGTVEQSVGDIQLTVYINIAEPCVDTREAL